MLEISREKIRSLNIEKRSPKQSDTVYACCYNRAATFNPKGFGKNIKPEDTCPVGGVVTKAANHARFPAHHRLYPG